MTGMQSSAVGTIRMEFLIASWALMGFRSLGTSTFMKKWARLEFWFSGLGGCPRLVIVTRLCRVESDFSIV